MSCNQDHSDMVYYQTQNDMAYNQNGRDHDANELDMDHPNSNFWPEVFVNGREQFSKHFYKLFSWARGIDPFEEGMQYMSACEYLTFRGQGLPNDFKAEAPPVLEFVKSLISLELDDLPYDERHCPVCTGLYRAGEYKEIPLELPCQHVIGKECLLTWLSGFSGIDEKNSHDTCPICRRELITEIRQPIDTLDGLVQLLKDANYLLTAEGPLTLTDHWRHQWEGVKEYVTLYLEEEKLNLEQKKLRQRIFVEAMQYEVSEAVSNAGTNDTIEQTLLLRDQLFVALGNLQKDGFIEAYLEEQAGENPGHSDFEQTLRILEADEAMPFGLGQLIRTTYLRCKACNSPGCQPIGEFDAMVTHAQRPHGEGTTPLNAETSRLRYKELIDMVRHEILSDNLQSHLALPHGQEGIVRFAISRAFEDAQQRGIVWAWLETADSFGLGPGKAFDPKADGIQQLLECVIEDVYRNSL